MTCITLQNNWETHRKLNILHRFLWYPEIPALSHLHKSREALIYPSCYFSIILITISSIKFAVKLNGLLLITYLRKPRGRKGEDENLWTNVREWELLACAYTLGVATGGVLQKKGFLKNFEKFTWKQSSGLRSAILLKTRLQHRCFPVTFPHFFRTPFFTEHLWATASSRYIDNCYFHETEMFKRNLN